jgi:hypothetical protein
MYTSSDFLTQPGLRRVLDAVRITAAEMKVTPDLELSIADCTADNVVYLADVRNRDCHNDDPSRPTPGAAGARCYEPNFLRATATDRHCAA